MDAFVALLLSDDDFRVATFDKALQVVTRERMLDTDTLTRFATLCERLRAAAPQPDVTALDGLLRQSELAKPAAAPDAAAAERTNGEYCEAMRALLFDEASFGEGEAMRHHYAANLVKAGTSIPSTKQKRIVREMRQMAEGGSLPLHADGCIAVRHDEVRMDAMKAIVVGATGTPVRSCVGSNLGPLHAHVRSRRPACTCSRVPQYANGLFLFDVYFPYEYTQPTARPQPTACT